MQVNLTPHSEEIVNAQLSAGRFSSAEEVIEQALDAMVAQKTVATAVSLDEFEAILEAIAEDSDDLPELPESALTREGIYSDHD